MDRNRCFEKKEGVIKKNELALLTNAKKYVILDTLQREQYKIIVQERTKEKMSIRYVVNKEKRTCVALLENIEFDAINKINKMCLKDARFTDHANMYAYVCRDSKYVMPNKFVGVAKCSFEDNWDEEVGKRVAREKLLDKYHNELDKQLLRFLNNMLYVADSFAETLKLQ